MGIRIGYFVSLFLNDIFHKFCFKNRTDSNRCARCEVNRSVGFDRKQRLKKKHSFTINILKLLVTTVCDPIRKCQKVSK